MATGLQTIGLGDDEFNLQARLVLR